MKDKIEIKRHHWTSGQLMYEFTYDNGLRHGLEKWWSYEGRIWSKIPYKKDIEHGARIHFKY